MVYFAYTILIDNNPYGGEDMKKSLFIYNPLAGKHQISVRLDDIVNRFQNNNIFVQFYRFTGDDLNELIDLLKESEFSSIIISGGDGTLNTIINVMLHHNIHLPIGIIPSGTCNDFARSLGIPKTLEKGLDIILSEKKVGVDIGVINGERYFLNTCAGGLFANVPANTENELKERLGPFAYYLQALSEVVNISSFPLKIRTDDEIIEEDALLFLILNGKHGAGFTNVIEQAELTDGMMDILIIKNCSRLELAPLAFKVLNQGLTDDKCIRRLRTKACTIESSHKLLTNIDGEDGLYLPFSVEFINKGLEVFVP